MRSKTVVVLMIFGLLFSVAMAAQDLNKGASDITLEGAKKGNVNFPHHMHQNNIKDCQVCHDLFPQQLGIIQDLKNKGKLKKKQVMNNKCLKCHKAKKKAGEEAGPTKCIECHIK